MREFRSGDIVKSFGSGTLALLCQRSRPGDSLDWDVILGRVGDTWRWNEEGFELVQRRPYLGEWVSQNGELGVVVEVEDPCVAFTVAWYVDAIGVDHRYRTRYTTPVTMLKLQQHGLCVNYEYYHLPEPEEAEAICHTPFDELLRLVRKGRPLSLQDTKPAESRDL